MHATINKGNTTIKATDRILNREVVNIMKGAQRTTPTKPAHLTVVQAMMQECMQKVRTNVINTRAAAYIIVGRIRYIYYSTCAKGDDHFDTHSYIYMDHILFDNLIDLVESVIKYGSSGLSKDLLLTTIDLAIKSVEYEVDNAQIVEVIDELYNTFK